MEPMFLGLDVHSKQTTFCAQDAAGRVLLEGQTPTTRDGLAAMLKRVGALEQTRIALETGTQSNWVAGELLAAKMRPVIVAADEVRRKARRKKQKSDRRDAFEICDGLRRDQWEKIVWRAPAPVAALRQLLSRRRHFVDLATSQVNAAKFVLRSAGQTTQRLGLTMAEGWERLVARKELGDLLAFLKMHEQMWKKARAFVDKLDRQVRAAVKPFADVDRLLKTVPGVGPVTAATFIAVVGECERFPSSHHVVSYAGLAPSQHDSGDRECHGHITREGSPELRAMLCEAAQHSRRIGHPLNPYYCRLAAKAGPKKAIVAVAARLARILFQIWKKHERFDIAHLNIVRQPSTRTKHFVYAFKNAPGGAPAPAAAGTAPAPRTRRAGAGQMTR